MRIGSLGALAAPLLVAAAAMPTADDAPNPEAGLPIPPGAIRVELPDVRQPDGYSCGAAALMAICTYYGVGPRTLDAFKAELGTDPQRGTDYRAMVRFARALGLDARAAAGLDAARLEAAVARGHPVVVAIQAYAADRDGYRDRRRNDSGHYTVVIGYDAERYYLEDPSLAGRRGFLPKAELLRRWHDAAWAPGHPEAVERLGVEFGPGTAAVAGLRRAVPIE